MGSLTISSLFDAVPAFPADIPTLQIPKLSSLKLLQHDVNESRALYAAAKEHGFFLLDLQDSEQGRALLDAVLGAFQASKTFFSLDVEEKTQYELSKGNIG